MPGLLDYIPSQSDVQRTIADLLTAPRNRLRGLLDDPGAFLQSALSDVVPTDQQTQEQLARYRMPASQDYAMGPSEYDNKLRDIALGALTVYHGSPHKFDKFDMSKIGTGEGAQAYGHGLYFAENPKVAQSYMDVDPSVIPDIRRSILGKEVQPGTWEYKAASLVDEMPLAKAKKMVQGWIDNARPGEDVRGYQQTLSTLNQVASKSDFKRLKPQSNLYKVDLPDDAIAKMLDWDKPLSQQAPEVQAALANTKNKQLRAMVEYANVPYSEAIGGEAKTMGEAFRLLNLNLQGKSSADSAKASALLAKQGIPGIRYLDGGSRNAGQGTYNYVVFDDTLPTILERNGQKLK